MTTTASASAVAAVVSSVARSLPAATPLASAAVTAFGGKGSAKTSICGRAIAGRKSDIHPAIRLVSGVDDLPETLRWSAFTRRPTFSHANQGRTVQFAAKFLRMKKTQAAE